MKRSTGRRGFTLIELLVVIAIIGILASIVLSSLNGARAKGRDAKRVSDIKELQLALELYYDANSNYPTGNGTVASTLTTGLTSNGYISVIPTDPSGGTAAYGYVALPSGCDDATTMCTKYALAAQLESSGTALQGSYTGSQAITVNGATDNCSTTVNLFCAIP